LIVNTMNAIGVKLINVRDKFFQTGVKSHTLAPYSVVELSEV